jgi:hypothetical protein
MKKNYTVFLYAKNNIKLFESDVKIDIARQCIENLSEKYNSDLSLDNAWNFDKNARNAIVNKKDDLIKLYTKQEKRISKNFYYFDFNKIYNIIDRLNLKECENNLDDLYFTVLKEYIKRKAFSETKKVYAYEDTYVRHFINGDIKLSEWIKKIINYYFKSDPKNFVIDLYKNVYDIDININGTNIIVADWNGGIEIYDLNGTFIKRLYNVTAYRVGIYKNKIVYSFVDENSRYNFIGIGNKTYPLKTYSEITSIAAGDKLYASNRYNLFVADEKELKKFPCFSYMVKDKISTHFYKNLSVSFNKNLYIYSGGVIYKKTGMVNKKCYDKKTSYDNLYLFKPVILKKADFLFIDDYIYAVDYFDGYLYKIGFDGKIYKTKKIKKDRNLYNISSLSLPYTKFRIYKNFVLVPKHDGLEIYDKNLNFLKFIKIAEFKSFVIYNDIIYSACGPFGIKKIKLNL